MDTKDSNDSKDTTDSTDTKDSKGIKTIAVIGVAGQMGRGIAQVAAQAGRDVLVMDVDKDLAKAGVFAIGRVFTRLVEKEKMTAEERDTVMARIRPVTAYSELESCDMVIEAAPEQEALKLDIFTRLDEATPHRVILATNTSSISITKLGSVTSRPERVIGMHFMNPVPLMKLVEIVHGLATSKETFDTTVALAQEMGKTTIASRDNPGFIVNRILIPMLNEACFALHEGMGTPQDIDTGIQLGLNHPMGPLALADLIGLDTCLAIAEVLHRELGEDKYRPCPLLRQYVAAGWLGRKVARGFYRYDLPPTQ
jgi:3-hydroxybutyryl-CoA dehydrogenase